MIERLCSTDGMLFVGAKPNYSEKLPVPSYLPQISHGRLWDTTWTFAERCWVLTARAMARPAAVSSFPLKITLYWSINLRIVYLWTGLGRYPYYSAGSPTNDGTFTAGNLSFHGAQTVEMPDILYSIYVLDRNCIAVLAVSDILAISPPQVTGLTTVVVLQNWGLSDRTLISDEAANDR